MAEANAQFKTVWMTYTASTEKIKAELQPRIETLQQSYKKSLETLKASVQRSGDLTKTETVVAEIARFEAEKTVPVPAVRGQT